MHFQFIKPSGILNHYIKHYWIMETDAAEGNVSERVIPTGSVQLMFHYKKPFFVKHTDNSVTYQPQSMVSGISNTYFDVSTRGEAGVITVVFYPAGACHFFDFPLYEIGNQSIDLRAIFNNEMRQIEAQIGNSCSIPEKIRLIEHFLLKKFTPAKETDYLLIQHAINLIKLYKGGITAYELAANLSLTKKTLERKFSILLGKTPKQFIKLIRFQEAAIDLGKTNKNLTEQGYKFGYFDQSHFIKEFKMFSGYTPKEFIVKCCDNVEMDFN